MMRIKCERQRHFAALRAVMRRENARQNEARPSRNGLHKKQKQRQKKRKKRKQENEEEKKNEQRNKRVALRVKC